MPMLYHSPLTRWVLIMSGAFAGTMLTVGPDRWRATPSLTWLAQSPVPLQAWGVALVIYASMLARGNTRPAGYALGAALWAVFTISVAVATIPSAGPVSSVALAAFVDVTAFHAFSIKTAWAQKLNQP